MTKQEIVKKVVLELAKEFRVSEFGILDGIGKGNITMRNELNKRLKGYL